MADDDDASLGPDSTSGSAMDLDFMDQLLYDGCWLETTDDGFSFSQPVPSTSQCFPFTEPGSNLAITQQIHQKSITNDDHKAKKLAETESESHHSSAVKTTKSLVLQYQGFPVESNELSRSFWIGPKADPGPSSSVKQRLMDAIGQLKQYAKDTEVLVQIWLPTKKEGKSVLTTIGQPCFLGLKSESLESYRYVSQTYHFSVEGDSKDFLGLPGRVFLGKLPESTPDVRFFKTAEYPRKNYAKQFNISGSLAVPVFEMGTGTCLGVVEVVRTSRNINYRPELESICKALEAFDLRSSHDFCPPSIKACKEFCQAAVPEISEVLESVCKKYKLPLALTWARCFQQGKGGCRHFDEKFARCISTVDSACFAADEELISFHVACSEQYLFLGQGIVGKAFITNNQCFASDITAFTKTDYPLSHHAKILDLHAAVAIPLRSTDDGSAEFVLELFLPKDCQDPGEQKKMCESLLFAIQQACYNLHVVMDKEIEEHSSRHPSAASIERHSEVVTRKSASSSLTEPSSEGSSWIAQMMEAQQKGKNVCVSWDNPKGPKEEFKVATHWDDTLEKLYQKQVLTECGQLQQHSGLKNSIDGGTDPSFTRQQSSGHRKPGEKRRTKTEKTIGLEVLRQYFAGSLKDAAKSIGVCPTTLKRICRQHGITRWPSRKLKKVGHSLKKLQLVIDSVQGAEGSIQIGSFYATFPELTSPNFSGNNPSPNYSGNNPSPNYSGNNPSPNFSGNNPLTSLKTMTNDDSKQPDPQPENGFINAGAAASKSPSSSCSQSSGSSFCCPIEAKQISTNNSPNAGDPLTVEDLGAVLKRTRSDAGLHALNREESKPLARSQSHKLLADHPEGSGRSLRDSGACRVKANFREDKVRFSLQQNCDFKDLQQELAKRFGIQDVSRVDLKYLDDDQEWVLLTCDADLDECRDIFRMSQSRTIKISVHQASSQPVQQSGGG
ncbi:protein NLP2-like [Mercurialis annua]|uniref:protein NLP2-like n=1 Tax=Mercurialis annua TaxID=3986 RepID=UPI0021602774|nr:protein NLP2-like [Mercurialis annua]XP_050231586.1 protein NLP2-like [Mercurialis annua]